MVAQSRKSVNFSEEFQAFEGENYVEDTPLSELFYTEDEIEEMRCSNVDIATKIRVGKLKDDNINNTLRGLELEANRCKMKQSMKNIEGATRAVINEQAKQKRVGKCDPMAISNVYLQNGAKESRANAAEMGKLDYEAALKCFEEKKKRISIKKAVKRISLFKPGKSNKEDKNNNNEKSSGRRSIRNSMQLPFGKTLKDSQRIDSEETIGIYDESASSNFNIQ